MNRSLHNTENPSNNGSDQAHSAWSSYARAAQQQATRPPPQTQPYSKNSYPFFLCYYYYYDIIIIIYTCLLFIYYWFKQQSLLSLNCSILFINIVLGQSKPTQIITTQALYSFQQHLPQTQVCLDGVLLTYTH